ncbi:Reverse transcriptase domain-containing protein [Aphis craccivora]|uniref:Reverse transcriptase domain-containing protein n=1 Tax=Aphis craccivora TaxID=307492 RepID=A0A6G0W0H9_APHCR|nr:Reverse transcriptase domain-containing protein [Aphis craccivora]
MLRINNYVIEVSFDTGINDGFNEYGQVRQDRNRSIVGNVRAVTSIEDGGDGTGFPYIGDNAFV